MHSRKQHKDRSVKLSGRCSICEWNKPAHSIQAIGLPISNQYNRSSRAWSSAEIKTVAWLKTSPFLINCRCDDWPPSTCTCGPWTTRGRYDHDRIPLTIYTDTTWNGYAIFISRGIRKPLLDAAPTTRATFSACDRKLWLMTLIFELSR